MFTLRKDWEQLDKVKELIEDGPIDYLSDNEIIQLYKILDKMESNIRDILSIKELGNFKRR